MKFFSRKKKAVPSNDYLRAPPPGSPPNTRIPGSPPPSGTSPYAGRGPAVYGTPQQQGGYQQEGGHAQQNSYPQPQQPQHYGNQTPYQQQQQHGGTFQGPCVNDPGIMSLVNQKIHSIISVNRLQAFYQSPQAIQEVVDRVGRVDLRKLGEQFRVNTEIVIDLTSLALYDVCIYADDSSSMGWKGGENIDDLKSILEKTASIVGRFDHDGFSIRQMNTPLKGDHIRTATEAAEYIKKINFKGGTPLAAQLEARVLEPMLFEPIRRNCLQKPLLIVTITDGAPGEPEAYIKKVIRGTKNFCRNSQYGDKAVALQFAQVGKDLNAQEFLSRLDNDPDIGAMIDATSYYELEAEEYARRGVTLTPDLWLVKLLVGAIDPEYDEADEVRK